MVKNIFRSPRILLTLIPLICGTLVIAFSFTGELKQSGDESYYLIMGMSLAQGHGFSNIALPDAPKGIWWPPGFPLFIAGFYLLFGANWVALKIIILVLLFSSFVLFARKIYKEGNTLVDAALILLAVSLSSSVHQMSSSLYAETFYLAATLLFFILWWHWEKSLSLKKLVTLAIFATYIASVRHIGIALVFAFSLHLFITGLKGGCRKWYFLFPLIFYFLFAAALMTVPSLESQQLQYHANDYGSVVKAFGNGDFFSNVLSGFKEVYLSARGLFLNLVPQTVLRSMYDSIPLGKVKTLTMLVILIIIGIGWMVTFRKFSLLNLYSLLFCGVILIYGPWYDRLMVPIAPFLLFYLYFGLKTMLARLIKQPAAMRATLIVIWFAVVFSNGFLTLMSPRKNFPMTIGDQDFQKSIEWVVMSAGKGEVIQSQLSTYLFLRRGEFIVPFRCFKSREEFLTYLNHYKVKYIVISPFYEPEWKSCFDTIHATEKGLPEHFRKVFGQSDSRSYVLEYERYGFNGKQLP